VNKGRESMEAALEMIELLAPLTAPQPRARKAPTKKGTPKKKGRR